MEKISNNVLELDTEEELNSVLINGKEYFLASTKQFNAPERAKLSRLQKKYDTLTKKDFKNYTEDDHIALSEMLNEQVRIALPDIDNETLEKLGDTRKQKIINVFFKLMEE